MRERVVLWTLVGAVSVAILLAAIAIGRINEVRDRSCAAANKRHADAVLTLESLAHVAPARSAQHDPALEDFIVVALAALAQAVAPEYDCP